MSETARVHSHPVLGTFAFNSALDSWLAQSKVPLGGTDEVKLSLTVTGAPDIPAERFDQAAAIVGRLDPRTLRRDIAEQYLDLYNDTWSVDEEDLDHNGFCARIRPTSVDIDADGVWIYFDDGDLFFGHSIVMLFDLDLQLTDIKLAG